MRADQLPKAVIFDMDGVLTDSEPMICSAACAMFLERGLTVQPEDFSPFVGTGENSYLGGVAKKYQFHIDIPAAKKRTYEIYLDRVPGHLKAFPGAEKLVRDCRAAGLKIALASSADPIKIEANLAAINLPPGFWDAVVSGADVVHKKPAPDLFLEAARRLQEPPQRCVVVEDAMHGIQAALAAGMRCVAVAHTFPRSQLCGATLVRETVAGISLEDLLNMDSNGTPATEVTQPN
jgi:HAD superfamily hydrolase (TIGR01509 family)